MPVYLLGSLMTLMFIGVTTGLLVLIRNTALKQVNKVLELKGLPPLIVWPLGARNSRTDSPLARALPDELWIGNKYLCWQQIGTGLSAYEEAWERDVKPWGTTANGHLSFLIQMPPSVRLFQWIFNTGRFYEYYDINKRHTETPVVTK